MSARIDKIQPTNHGNLRENLVHIVGRVLAWPNAGDESAILPHVVRCLIGIEDDRDIEEAEEDDQHDESQVVERFRAARARLSMLLSQGLFFTTGNWRAVCGSASKEEAKIIGMTPPGIDFERQMSGLTAHHAPPMTRFAYCTGMRRSPRSTSTIKPTTAIITAKIIII